MVEHPHVNQLQRILQAFGQHPVGLTGVGVARGMVVAEDHCRCIVGQGTLDHLS
ncbi:hypothetical protein D3C81_2133140 [compost metagenome]